MRIRLKCVLTLIGVCLAVGNMAVPANAQKKGGTSASASPTSPSAASPSANPAAAPAPSGPFEEQVLAYWSLDQVVGKLANYSCATAEENKASRILILDSPTLQALQAFDSFYTNAEALTTAFQKMAGASGAGAAGIDVFADITNAVAAAATASNSETSSSFTIPDPTAALMLLRQMQETQKTQGCPQQLYGGVYSVDAGAPTVGGKKLNSVETEISSLSLERAKALGALRPKIDADGKVQPNPTIPCQATPTPTGTGTNVVLAVSSQDPCIVAFNNLDATYNAFLAGLSSPNASTGQPGLTSVLQGYRLRALFANASKTAPKLGVYLSVVAAGGTQQDRKNLLTNLFTGDLIRYSGGVSVNTIVFLIAGDDSKILYSDLLRYRTPLKKIQKPKSYKGTGNAGDNLDSIPVVASAGSGTGRGATSPKKNSKSDTKSNP
jgi:hypothetical protein